MNDVDIIAEAYPRSSENGKPMCAHCGGYRPGYFALCVACWDRLSPFVKIEFTRARSRMEKAQIILGSREQLP